MSHRPIDATIRTRPDAGPTSAALRPELLREALSFWASGVTVLAVSDGEEVDAITVSAFCPVSLDPPLVLACVNEQSSTLPTLLEEGRFTVNVLPEEARRTASMVASRLPLRELPFASEGAPVLAGALVSFVCRLRDAHPAGDHRIVVGEVERVELGADARPLVYYRRDYRGLRDGPLR